MLYIMKHTMSDSLKLGVTSREPRIRAQEHSRKWTKRMGYPVKFEVVATFEATQEYKIEHRVLKALRTQPYTSGYKEFLHTDVDTIINAIKTTIGTTL